MSVRNALFLVLGLAAGALLVCPAGCESVRDTNYFSEVKGGGGSTAEKTNVPEIMQQMRVANLQLVNNLMYMNAQGIMSNSVQMYELAKALEQTQPAVALQSPDDMSKYRKLADDLANVIVEVGRAANANRLEIADTTYAQAFPMCNNCHRQFRVTLPAKPLAIPELEKQAVPGAAPAPAAGTAAPAPAEGAVPVPAPAPADAAPAPAPVPVPAPAP